MRVGPPRSPDIRFDGWTAERYYVSAPPGKPHGHAIVTTSSPDNSSRRGTTSAASRSA